MEEKVLIQSKHYKVKKFFLIMVAIGVLLSISLIAFYLADMMHSYDRYRGYYLEHLAEGSCGEYYDRHERSCYYCEEVKGYTSGFDYGIDQAVREEMLWLVSALLVVSCSLVGGLVYFWLRRCELTVTDRRIYGHLGWGKPVSISVDAVSKAVAVRWLKGIRITAGSGKIRFHMIRNGREICRAINDLRDSRKAAGQPVKQNSLAQPVVSGEDQKQAKSQTQNSLAKKPSPDEDAVDQLKRYKELMDLGVITKKEFKRKKKQLLDL